MSNPLYIVRLEQELINLYQTWTYIINNMTRNIDIHLFYCNTFFIKSHSSLLKAENLR